jgi:hypothetical protein
MNQMPRGGFRVGAGRKPENPKIPVQVRLPPDLARHFRSTVPAKQRSAVIERLLLAFLKKHQRAL